MFETGRRHEELVIVLFTNFMHKFFIFNTSTYSSWCHGIFHWHKSFRSHYGPGVDSASNRNEYQEFFLGVNAAGAYGWQTYHHPVPLSRNLGTLTSWNPLGHSRQVTGLLYLTFIIIIIIGTAVAQWLKYCATNQKVAGSIPDSVM
jgi:hypothetical protein